MFRKIDYGLGSAVARTTVMPVLFLTSSALLRLYFPFCIPSSSPPPRFIPRAFYLLVMIAQGDVENKPTARNGVRLMDIALCSVMMRSPAGINRMR